MSETEKGKQHQPARWVLIVLVSGLASVILGDELGSQIRQLTNKRNTSAWVDLNQHQWDPNKASRAELELIPGIGPTLAQNILDARKTQHFKSIEDLGKIKGFGPQRLGLMGPWLQFPEEKKEAKQQPFIDQNRLSDTKDIDAKTGSAKKLDPNLASAEDLQNIPGIGPKMAKKIIDERLKKKFESVEDLIRVQGIGPKNIEKLRPFLSVAP